MRKLVCEKQRFIHFDQCDSAGIMYFAESFTLAHQLIEDFIASSAIGWSAWFNHETLAFPLRYADCNYRYPLRAGEKCQLKLNITDLSYSSVTFSTKAYDNNKGVSYFEVTTIHTTLNKNTESKDQFPKDFHTTFEYYIK